MQLAGSSLEINQKSKKDWKSAFFIVYEKLSQSYRRGTSSASVFIFMRSASTPHYWSQEGDNSLVVENCSICKVFEIFGFFLMS